MEAPNLAVCKSRDQAKGPQKLKSCDGATNQPLIAWKMVNMGVGQKYTGVSATRLLCHLAGCYGDEMDDGIDYDDHDADEDINEERPTFEDATSPIVEKTVRISPSEIKFSPSKIFFLDIGPQAQFSGLCSMMCHTISNSYKC